MIRETKMNVLIQQEFVKLARKWKDMSLEDQKGYLSRHPKSKRKLTGKSEGLKTKSKDTEELKTKSEDTEMSQSYSEFAQNLKDKFGDNAELWAKKKIEKLQEKMDRTQARAIRREQRAHGDLDGTAIEAAYDVNRPREQEINILKHFISNGTKKLPKELEDEYNNLQENKKYEKEHKEKRQEEKAEHADLMDKVITWKSRKHFGQEFSGRVVAVKSGKHGPYVKTDTGWKVPVSLITKTKNPSKEDKGKVQIEPEELVGKTIRWKTKYHPANPFRRRRTFNRIRVKQEPPSWDRETRTAGGIVTGVKGSNLIVGGWKIPLSLIESVDGKKFSQWK